ncbi:carboxymuconolactone decarboxylase family protein [Amycolatopsis keratiniphila]|uniref:carboxymuconolactone decarboxylase family protein n=1 Tax=Amycolatopsis keratiniphila TaxID=129921 RepID=UPI00061880AD|nr:carboxymuconolactone decarboxylase family protein [Amycolatopsis keratiniphila]
MTSPSSIRSATTVSTSPPSRRMVSLRASQLNGCGFCVDAHAKDLAAAGEPAVRVNLVAALVYLVAMINAANRLLVITHTKGGSYQAGTFDAN